MKDFCAIRAKPCTWLMEDDSETKKTKGIKGCVIKRRLMFVNYKDSLFNNKAILRSQLMWEVNKIALNTNDNKRLQTFDRVTTYSYEMKCFYSMWKWNG